MSKAVIGLFKVIQIDQAQGEMLAFLNTLAGRFQLALAKRAIGEPGQVVEIGELFQFALGFSLWLTS